ncbi:MAG: hypothetical protein QOD03_1138, partial [Verrucomicrobiota bacterium]
MKPFREFINRAIVFSLVSLLAGAASASELLPPGFRPLPLGVHALVGGKIITKPGEMLENATVIIRDGFIQEVGKDIVAPADARVWDMKGKTIYAGFIEPYLVINSTNPPISTTDTEPISQRSFTAGGIKFFGAPGAQTDMGSPGPGYEISKITPEFRALDKYSPKEKSLASLRELGFTAGIIAPARGIIRGTSALVALTDENPNRALIRPDVFQHISFETDDDDSGIYPGSLMGVIAAVRQSFFDAQHYTLDHADYQKQPQGRKRPEFNPALAALAPAAEKKIPVMFEPGSALMDDRAAHIARELGLDFCLISSGQEWRRPDLAKQTGATFIVPLNFPSLPKLPSDDDWEQITLDQLRTWDWAPENPALLRQQGLDIALTTYGLGDKKTFRKNLRTALDRGLSEADALAALTTIPAKLCGVENQLGTIEPGKLANLVIVDGENYFDPETKVNSVWIDGRIYSAPAEEAKTAESDDKRNGAKPKEEPEKNPKPPSVAEAEPKTTAPTGETVSTNATAAATPEPKAAEKKKNNELRALQKARVARAPLEGRGAITNPPSVLIRNATIWTGGPAGILTNAQLLVSAGKILSVGSFKTEPGSDTLVVDAAGQQISPGIIDCHSHTAILGAVNESTLPSTAMVRIRDVVNSETVNIY